MSRKIICDRCGSEITSTTVWVVEIESELHDWDSRSRYDLCPGCYRKFKDWVAGGKSGEGEEQGCADA